MTGFIYSLIKTWAVLRGAYYWRRRPLRNEYGQVIAWVYGDHRHDDRRNFQKALNRQPRVIHIPPGDYLLGSVVKARGDVEIVGGNPAPTIWSARVGRSKT